MVSTSPRRAVRSSGGGCSGRFDGTCAVGVRQLRRKRPAGGGSVPESTGAAADGASEVSFARFSSLFAVAANDAFEAISFCDSDLLFICRAQAS